MFQSHDIPTEIASGSEEAIGRVVSVSGAKVVVAVHGRSWAQTPSGNPLQVGAFVRVGTPTHYSIGMINGLSIPIPEVDPGAHEIRIMEVELLGELVRSSTGQAVFQRGVSSFPGLSEQVYAASQWDLERLYAGSGERAVRIGRIHQDERIPASLLVNGLLGQHFAILGTTGSGKSCCAALILRRILETNPHAHMVIIDPHGEYASAFEDCAEVILPHDLSLPYWIFNFEEISEIVIGESDTAEEEERILHDFIVETRQKVPENTFLTSRITADTPLPYHMRDLLAQFDAVLGRLDRPKDLTPYHRLRRRLSALLSDPRFAFMFGHTPSIEELANTLSRIFRVPTQGKPVTVLDLSGVPSETTGVVVSLLGRLTFDVGLWSNASIPVLLVCEEAHRYVPYETKIGPVPASRALSRIAKEGRKYGVSLCVISQRPSEVAAGVVSECNTIFAMRLTNQQDQDFIRASVAESGIGLLEALPSLRNGEAIVIGEGIAVPSRVSFDELEPHQRPRSQTIDFSEIWQGDPDEQLSMEQIVNRWCRQQR